MTFQLTNQTNAVTAVIPTKGADGREYATVIAKYRFMDRGGFFEPEIDPRLNRIDLVDSFNGEDPGKSSIRHPSQIFDSKPGTDVLLLGHAHPQSDKATQVDVALQVGPISKTVRAYGFRVFKRGSFGGVSAGPALPIRAPVPLVYELAYGGMDLSDEKRPVGEPRNYVGRGVVRFPESLIGEPAHQLEYAGRSTAPASFGAIHRHWAPRAQWAGTYDERWMETRMPMLPEDFDERFHVCVPEDQWSATPLRSDEPIDVTGATPEGRWEIRLPRLALGFTGTLDRARVDLRNHLDTILIDADERAVELTYRASMPLPPKWERVGKFTVLEKTIV